MKKLGVLLAALLSVTGCGVEQVDTGEVGVKVTFGKPDPTPLKEGIYMYNPLTSSIVTMSYQVQAFPSRYGYDDQYRQTQAYTKDVQQATLSYVVTYTLNAAKAVEMYQNVGIDWERKLVPQVVVGSIKNVVGTWNAVDLVSNRPQVTKQIEDSVRAALGSRDVTVVKFDLTNIDFSGEFEKAVEAKVVAAQEAERAKNQTVRVQEEANQRVIAAKAEAESMQIRTQALSQNQALVMYEAVQKWDGMLPTMITGDAAQMLLQLNK